MRWFILITVILCFLYTRIFDIYPTILGDGLGYYSYLPSIFIHHDINMSYFPPNYFLCVSDILKTVNKHTVGTSILMLPFFFTGHTITYLTKEYLNGFSYYYQFCIFIGTLFYWGAGIYFVYKILIKKIDKKTAIFTCAIITYGTGAFNYIVYEPSYSHIYSFFAISLFLWMVVNKKSDFLIGLVLGLIFMIRNMNALVILFYIFNTKPKKFFIMLLGFFVAIIPQILYWFKQTGHFIVNPYSFKSTECYLNNLNCQIENFNWLKPKVLSVLFSLKSGLFVYYPVLIFSLLGIKSTKKYFKTIFLPSILFILIVTYILSSWYGWSLGVSFGERIYVDYLSIFAIFIASFLQDIKNKKTQFLLMAVMTVFAIITIYLTYLHWSQIYNFDKMF